MGAVVKVNARKHLEGLTKERDGWQTRCEAVTKDRDVWMGRYWEVAKAIMPVLDVIEPE